MTNGDKLRQMTDEELAEFLETSCGFSVCLLDHTSGQCLGYQSRKECVKNKINWLKKEVSET